MLSSKNTIAVVIDVQEKLIHAMHEKTTLLSNLQKLVAGSKALGVPMLWTEQYPEGLGPTIPDIAEHFHDMQPIVKRCFSCCGHHQFITSLEASHRKQVVIVGIETHVCVYQTAMDLLRLGYEVQVVADAVSSRTAESKHIGLQRMRQAGAIVSSTEMVLFELLKVAEGPKFKEILKIIK